MKRLFKYIFLLISIFIFFNSKTYSQPFFTIGYNAGVPLRLDSLNYVLDRYNETRSYLTSPMEHINYLDGLTFSVGGGLGGPFFWGLGYTGGKQVRFAEGKDISGDFNRREIKVTARSFDMDLGLALVDESDIKGALYLGGTLNVGVFNIKSRLGLESEIKDMEWVKINNYNSLFFTSGVFLRLVIPNPGFFIQPYYLFTPGDFFQNDMTDLNGILNSNTYQNDPSPLHTKNNMFGVKVGFGLIIPKI